MLIKSNKLMQIVIGGLLVLCLGGWGPFSFFFSRNNEQVGTEKWMDKEIELINSQADNIDSDVLKLGLTAYIKAREQGLDNKQLLTIIDYSKPSNERRLWVVNLKNHRVLFNTWVSHGKNSGISLPTSFSNEPGSLKSSLGLFLTEKPYIGGNGYSLRLIGLEQGINDNAYRRDIVVHGAWYVHPEVVKKYGQVGRSWGCPAVGEELARPLIDTIKENTLVFVYSKDQQWLKNSAYLVG